MTDFMDQYAAQFRAAAEQRGARGRRERVAPFAVGALAAGVFTFAVLAGEDAEIERTPPVTTASSGYAQQRALLGVLREPTPADRDPQVRSTVRDFRDERPRTGRLLGKAPSGSAYVLVATRRYPETTHVRRGALPPRPEVRWRRDGLCLMRRGTQGGAGHCVGTDDLLAGRLAGAIGGQAYGVVPDGVTHVRPGRGGEPVAVRRNFYVFAVRGNPSQPPVWLDAQGEEVPRRLTYLNRPGGGSLADFRGRVTVVGLWASWCAPCRQQLRELQAVHERQPPGGVAVVGVASSDLADDARTVIERRGVAFPVLDDPEVFTARRLGAARAFPATVVLAADGRIVARLAGTASAERIEEAVSRAR